MLSSLEAVSSDGSFSSESAGIGISKISDMGGPQDTPLRQSSALDDLSSQISNMEPPEGEAPGLNLSKLERMVKSKVSEHLQKMKNPSKKKIFGTHVDLFSD